MVIIFLVLLGLCLGSFVNALVWRLHEQSQTKNAKKLRELSVLHGRSVCPHCNHQLKAIDLIPVLSWLSLKGKCRYCKKAISRQYPLVELLTAGLLVLSYVVWPYTLQGWSGPEIAIFGLWTAILTGFVALTVYDLRWYTLPNKIVFPLTALGVAFVGLLAITYQDINIVGEAILGMGVIFGLFYLLFQVSKEKWIGGGDVKLAVLLGLLAGGFMEVLLLLFLASVCGTLYSVILATLGKQKLSRKLQIPFGPFLIAATIIVVLFGLDIINWYSDLILSV
jgi:leader peptidase (prepilin peptidase)/N-methyltransferase